MPVVIMAAVPTKSATLIALVSFETFVISLSKGDERFYLVSAPPPWQRAFHKPVTPSITQILRAVEVVQAVFCTSGDAHGG
jgi:hypothetical protein